MEVEIMTKIEVMQDMMEINNNYAAENHKLFQKKGVFVVNIMGSPGAGKTALLEKLLSTLQQQIKAAVIEGDLATARDAARIVACNVPVIQINTNGGCHLDAKMISKVLPGFYMDDIDLMIIENVGNLVCPAAYDLGEDMKLLVMSIAEGGDKPAKYPTAFLSSEAVVLNKVDLMPFVNVDLEEMETEILEINPKIKIFETCCRQGEVNGIDELADWLIELVKEKKNVSRNQL